MKLSVFLASLRTSALLLVLVLGSILAHAEFVVEVIGVIDGDSIRVLHDGKAEQIRLLGIDCPRSGSPSAPRPRSTGQCSRLGEMSRCTGTNASVMEAGRGRAAGWPQLVSGTHQAGLAFVHLLCDISSGKSRLQSVHHPEEKPIRVFSFAMRF